MWNVNPDKDKSRGGFQDRDLGKTQFDNDYGPDFGVDYARFSDPPDFRKDFQLKSQIENELSGREFARMVTFVVRNGFIILKGSVPNDIVRGDLIEFVKTIPGVVEVINQIVVNDKLS